jgi:predicted nucleic acid-binding protein
MVEMLVNGERAKLVEERIAAEEYTLWAPQLLDAEIGQALRRYVRFGGLDADVAGNRLWRIDRLPVERVEHELLIHFAWVLRDSISFYDALYVALAQLLEEPLLTLDARLARAGLNAEIEVLA